MEKRLKCWIKKSCKKVILTLFTGAYAQISEFNSFMMAQNIMYCNNALGIRQKEHK
jgi:hypothetical protein